jgi:hypothetical protein
MVGGGAGGVAAVSYLDTMKKRCEDEARAILFREMNRPSREPPTCSVCGKPATWVRGVATYLNLNGNMYTFTPTDWRCPEHSPDAP